MKDITLSHDEELKIADRLLEAKKSRQNGDFGVSLECFDKALKTAVQKGINTTQNPK